MLNSLRPAYPPNVQLALSVSHRAYVLESGRLVLAGSAREVLESEPLRTVYLGI